MWLRSLRLPRLPRLPRLYNLLLLDCLRLRCGRCWLRRDRLRLRSALFLRIGSFLLGWVAPPFHIDRMMRLNGLLLRRFTTWCLLFRCLARRIHSQGRRNDPEKFHGLCRLGTSLRNTCGGGANYACHHGGLVEGWKRNRHNHCR